MSGDSGSGFEVHGRTIVLPPGGAVEVVAASTDPSPPPDPDPRIPQLICALQKGALYIPGVIPKARAQYLVGAYPEVDAWVVGYFGVPRVEELVREIRALGKIVIRAIDVFSAWYEGRSANKENWERVQIECVDRWDTGLSDEVGHLLDDRWYGRGPVLNWSVIDSGSRAWNHLLSGGESGFLDDAEQISGLWWIDGARSYLREWMLRQGVTAVRRGEYTMPPGRVAVDQKILDRLHDRDRYRANVTEWMRQFGLGRRVFVNGDETWSGVHGFGQMYEQANNDFHQTTLEQKLEDWRTNPVTVLEVRGVYNPQAKAIFEHWERYGGYLWADNETIPFVGPFPSEIQRRAMTIRGAAR